ncbi:MAG: COG1361 S-layer family protein [Lachnospiraceae bacterium]
MKWTKFKSVGAVALALMVVMVTVVMASGGMMENLSAETTSSTTTETTASEKSIATGNENEISVSGVITESAGASGQAGIGFWVSIDEKYVGNEYEAYKIISVRPVEDSSGPMVSDNAMYAVAMPTKAEEERSLWCGFVFNVKGNIKTAYYPIAFEVEYEKNGTHYRVEKSIDVALFGKEEETTKTDESTSVPRIIVTGFETNPAKVMAGEEFELTVHLQNTSNRTAVSNIKVSLNTANNEFLPASGSSTQFIRSMGCGATKDITIKMKAQASLEQKPYVLTVKCEYEGEKNAPYTADESISVPVYQEAKAKITNVEVSPESIETYSQANVMFSINNTGKSTLYNVQVSVDPENKSVQAEDSFVGNIAPGTTGYADFMVNGIAATEDDGIVKVIISYEDANGDIGTFEQDINLFVYEPYYDDPGMNEGFVDEGMFEEPQEKGFPWLGLIVGIVVVVIIVTVVVVVIKKKKVKALREELEDEIS